MPILTRNAAIASGLSALAVGAGILYMTTMPPRGTSAPAPSSPAPSASAPAASAPSSPAPAAAPAPSTGGPVPYAALQQGGAPQSTPSPSATGTANPYAMLPPPPANPAQDPTVWPDGVAAETFTTFVAPFTFVRDSVAYAAASGDAPQLYPLRAGTAIATAEKSSDGKWLIAMTEDGKPAYLLSADLGPYDPSRQPQADLPPVVSGVAQVVDTGMLTINGQQVPLVGVRGETGEYATQLQQMINANGPQVTCSLRGDAYQCNLPNGLDIARSALFNGAAEPTDDASDDYRAQADAARQAHRGIWN